MLQTMFQKMWMIKNLLKFFMKLMQKGWVREASQSGQFIE